MKKPSKNNTATTRKLKLARETLRLLSPAEIEVAGGGTSVGGTDGCRTYEPTCVSTI